MFSKRSMDIYKGWIKNNGNSFIFLAWLYSLGYNIYVPYIQYSRPLIYHLLPNVWKVSYTIRASMFVDVPYWPPYSTDKYILLCSAVGQAVECTPVTQRARVRSPVRTSFLGEVFFRGFTSSVRQMSGSFRPPRSPNIIWPSFSSSIIHSLRAPMTWDVDVP